MIRRGKRDGWLTLPVDNINTWAVLNGVRLDGCYIGKAQDAEHKGLSLIATNDSASLPLPHDALMTVPNDLILSKTSVEGLAKSDRHLRQLLEANEEGLAETTRGSILLFLLLAVTHACPDVPERVGVSSANVDYVKYLPLERLPTFWTEDELNLAAPTSLEPATRAKLNSLSREFTELRQATANLSWCRSCWWDDNTLTLDDWMQVDAMYRSRALEFPGIGDAMVPCIDMANHASGEHTVARYEADANDGKGLLLLLDGRKGESGSEITITYGDEKGACEMLFSYGFLETGMTDARDVFLDLQIPDDDPLRRVKQVMANSAPGVRIYSRNQTIEWHSQYVWCVCVNEEDGLLFRLMQTNDGDQELVVSWKGQALEDLSSLDEILRQDALKDLYELRATVCILERVQLQLLIIDQGSSLALDKRPTSNMEQQEQQKHQALELCELERRLLEKARTHLESKRDALAESATVRAFLGLD